MQSNRDAYKNFFYALTHICKNERFFGLFKGTVPLILNQIPNSAMYLLNNHIKIRNILDCLVSIIG